MKDLVLLMFLVANLASAQVRYLVTPNNDAIPLKPGESSAEAARRIGLPQSLQGGCSDTQQVGFMPDRAPTQAEYRIGPGGVVGMWFVVPASGTIDTVFWMGGSIVSSPEPLLLQIHRSNIYPGHGPGTPPYPDPCTPWGYWVNTNDPIGNVGPFEEEATDTTWQSTISGPGSFPPAGEELWGMGGYPVEDQANSLNSAAMSALGGPLPVSQGEAIFVSLRIGDSNIHGVDATTWPANVSQSFLPARDWVFYVRDGTSSMGLSGVPCGASEPAPAGWYARGGPTGLGDGLIWNWWFTMTVDSPLVPPKISRYDILPNTFSHSSRPISAEITDCFPAGPPESLSVQLVYSIDGGSENFLDMGISSPLAIIPGQAGGALVQYHVVAGNQVGYDEGYGSYRVYDLANSYYFADSAALYSWNEIESTGTAIGGWFVAPGGSDYPFLPNDPADNGTAGPIDLGGPFQFFDSTYRYAWVGVDGAVRLSANPADTSLIDWPSDVYPAYAPEIPGGLPRNCIAPLYKDFVIPPGTYTSRGHGQVYYKLDGERLIIEWDSVASAADSTDTTTTFELIFDRSDNTITFLYKDVGKYVGSGQSVTGLQQEPGSKWIFYNRNALPPETMLRNGLAVKFTPTAAAAAQWELVSNPNAVADPRREAIFPRALSPAYTYRSGYVASDTLKNGVGYWMKFSPALFNRIPGTPLAVDTVRVSAGWNMIGSVGAPIAAGALIQIPDSLIVSEVFGYEAGGYSAADTINPAIGYWVKAKAPGELILGSPGPLRASSGSLLRSCDRLIVRDARGLRQTLYFTGVSLSPEEMNSLELPPSPPGNAFDVRFAGNRIIESPAGGVAGRFPILISGAMYPVSIAWSIGSKRSYAGLSAGSGEIPIEGEGKIQLAAPDPAVALILSSGNEAFPAEFALSQNYPNPFNPTTVIRYNLMRPSQVTLRVYSILGEVVRELVNVRQEAGRHAVEFDARGLASGIYYYRLTAGGGGTNWFQETRKMVLVR